MESNQNPDPCFICVTFLDETFFCFSIDATGGGDGGPGGRVTTERAARPARGGHLRAEGGR